MRMGIPAASLDWRLTVVSQRGRGPAIIRKTSLQAEPQPVRGIPNRRRQGEDTGACVRRWSDQDEIEQRKKGRPNGGRHQGVVGAHVRTRVERWLVGFRGHVEDLGHVGRPLCEAGHIRPIFFRAGSLGTNWQASGLFRVDFLEAGAEGQAMGQQLQSWRTGQGQNLWLSMLVDAMEKFSRPEWRTRPCGRLELAAVRAQLARPAAAYPAYASRFSLRN